MTLPITFQGPASLQEIETRPRPIRRRNSQAYGSKSRAESSPRIKHMDRDLVPNGMTSTCLVGNTLRSLKATFASSRIASPPHAFLISSRQSPCKGDTEMETNLHPFGIVRMALRYDLFASSRFRSSALPDR